MNKIEIINISGVDCYEKDGTAYLNLEAVARGLGFTQQKNGVEYVRWETVKAYLTELGFSQQVGKEDFIPENIFYRLAMKAKNEAAEAFQAKIADEVIPSIRRHGAYMTPDTMQRFIADPDFAIGLLTALKDEQAKSRALEAENEKQSQLLADYEPKVQYLETILQSEGTMTTAQIAADYDMSAIQLNQILRDAGIQRKVNGQWILYRRHMGKGYTKSETINITRSDGRPDTKMHTRWTQKGRLMIHEVLTARGIKARMDK